jgi:hypothetical protein
MVWPKVGPPFGEPPKEIPPFLRRDRRGSLDVHDSGRGEFVGRAVQKRSQMVRSGEHAQYLCSSAERDGLNAQFAYCAEYARRVRLGQSVFVSEKPGSEGLNSPENLQPEERRCRLVTKCQFRLRRPLGGNDVIQLSASQIDN